MLCEPFCTEKTEKCRIILHFLQHLTHHPTLTNPQFTLTISSNGVGCVGKNEKKNLWGEEKHIQNHAKQAINHGFSVGNFDVFRQQVPQFCLLTIILRRENVKVFHLNPFTTNFMLGIHLLIPQEKPEQACTPASQTDNVCLQKPQ